jgi:molybdenum cofactor synthesis domain-containing protein
VEAPAPSSFATPADALDAVLRRLSPVGAEPRPLGDSLGLILADNALADRDHPPFDASARDGFAVRLADLSRGPLRVAGDVPIGAPPPDLPAGAALRIVTGAAVPAEADAIIMHESARVEQGRLIVDELARRNLRPGAFIRCRGETAPRGEVIARVGDELTAPLAAALATFGVASPLVHRAVRVALIVTGDEIVDPRDTPTDWQIRDGSASALGALFNRRRWINLVRIQRVGDEPAPLHEAIAHALAFADALLLTGGVSAGHRDEVPAALRDAGVETIFHRLPQRPGQPLLAGIAPHGHPVFGLPGNPVSVMVTARRFVVPALARLAGARGPMTHDRLAALEAWHGPPLDLWWHRLISLDANDVARLVEERGSHDVPAAARSDGFVEIPPHSTRTGPHPCYLWNW